MIGEDYQGPVQRVFRVKSPDNFDRDRVVRLRWEPLADERVLSIHFEIYESQGRMSPPDESGNINWHSTFPGIEGVEAFELDDNTVAGMNRITTDLDKAVAAVHGFVKWDGCTQMWFREPVHVDDESGLVFHHDVIRRVRRECLRSIVGACDETDYPPDDELIEETVR